MPQTTLGDELGDMLANLSVLLRKTRKESERKRIALQIAKVAGELQVLVDEEVARTLPEYRAATEALRSANAAAIEAKEDLDKIALALRRFAGAIDLLVRLAARVVG